MKGTLLPTCRISLLTALLAASFPEAGWAGLTGTLLEGGGPPLVFRVSSTPLARSRSGWAQRIASVLTRLNEIAGVESSSALLADNGERRVQIRIRKGAKEAKVVEEVRKVLRAEVQESAPVQLESKPAATVGPKQEWLTVGQLNAVAAKEEPSPRRFDMRYLLLALAVFLALGALLFWLLRRQRAARQRSEVRLDAPHLPFAPSM